LVVIGLVVCLIAFVGCLEYDSELDRLE
jgi:hypothetical protein